MEKFIKEIKNDYLYFINFKHTRDDMIFKLREELKQLKAEIISKSIEAERYENGENKIKKLEDKILEMNWKLSEVGIGKEVNKIREASRIEKDEESLKNDIKYEDINEEKKKIQLEIENIKNEIVLKNKIKDEIEEINKKIENIEEKIKAFNEEIDEKRKTIENLIDEQLKIKEKILEEILKDRKKSDKELIAEIIELKKSIENIKQTEIEEKYIELKEKTVLRLLKELSYKNKELEEQDNEYDNLYLTNKEDMEKLKNLKNNLYLKVEEILSQNIDLEEGKKIVEEVRKINEEKIKSENEEQEKNEDIEDMTEEKESKIFIIKLKSKFMNLVNKLRKIDENISIENNNENEEQESLRDRLKVESNETIIKTDENITKQEPENENNIEK